MKVTISSLSWDYSNHQTIGGETESICTGTKIEAEVSYPSTGLTDSVIFHGCIKYNGRICDINEAKKVVEGVIRNK